MAAGGQGWEVSTPVQLPSSSLVGTSTSGVNSEDVLQKFEKTAKRFEAMQEREEKLQQTLADTTKVVWTLMEDQKQMRKDQIALQQTVATTTKVVWTMMEGQKQMQKDQIATVKRFEAIQEREEKLQQTVEHTTKVVWTMLEDQKQMLKDQMADRKRIGQNERDIQDLNDMVERMPSTSSANASFTASSLGMGSGSWVQPICATFQQADMETCEAVSDKDELVLHVLANQSDPGPLTQHSLESKRKQSASAAEPSLEHKMLEEFKRVGATQERVLHALQHKEQVVSSSSGPDHEALQQTVADTTKVVRTMMDDQKQLQQTVADTTKVVWIMMDDQKQLQQTVADTTKVVWTMMDDQKQMRKDQIALQQTVADTTKVVQTMMEDQKQMRKDQIAVMEAGPVPLTSDVAKGTVDEDLLQQLCYMATGIKQLLISPDGGTFKLGSGDASLVFPPGAVEKETFIRYAIILHGPFVLPTGYKPGSVGVYLNLDGSTLVKPVQFLLCHWCIKQKEDDATLKFIRAPHTLEVGVKEYTYEELEDEADFTSYTNAGVLTIREPRCLYCVETEVDTIAKYSTITLTRNVPSDDTLFFRIQLMCDSLEWSKKLTGLLKQRGWQHSNSDIVPRFSYSSAEKPIEASATNPEGLGWVATIEGQHQVQETDFLMLKGKSKSDVEQEVNNGRFPPCLCYKILFTSPEERRVKPALLKVDLLGADVHLTFSCTFKEEPKLSVSSGPSLSAETPPSSSQPTIRKTADVIKALDQKLDAKWRKFGTFLYIEPAIMDRIEKDKSDVEDCMLQLVEDWVCNRDGTGDLHRTWKTVVQAVKEMKVPLPQKLEEQYGHLT